MDEVVEKESTPSEVALARKIDRLVRFLALLSALVLLSSIVVIVQYRQTRIQRAENSLILREINSCTEPGGECYEAGKRSQMLLEQESRQVIEHRDRNEELHDVICRRQDEIAETTGAAPLKVKCPPKITPHTDSE